MSRDGVNFPSFAAPPKMVNLCQRNEFTWIKPSGKSSSYGWAPSIWSGYKRQFGEGSNLPGRLYTTKRAALRYAVADAVETMRWLEEIVGVETDQEALEQAQSDLVSTTAELRALKRRFDALAK